MFGHDSLVVNSWLHPGWVNTRLSQGLMFILSQRQMLKANHKVINNERYMLAREVTN